MINQQRGGSLASESPLSLMVIIMKAIRFKRGLMLLALFTIVAAIAILIGSSSHRSASYKQVINLPSEPVSNIPFAANAATSLTDKQLQRGEALIKRASTEPDGYNLLCAAYMQKARETGDFNFNAKAELALNRSFAVAPDNYDALKLKSALLLTYHRFAEALEVARRLEQLRPQDHTVYGALADALIELGRYDEAQKAVETMMRLRPDAASYSRLSYQFSLRGKTEAAIEVMRAAVKASTAQDGENLAWYRAHLGDELMKAGKRKEAEREFDLALAAFPNYHVALAAKARSRIAAGDLNYASELYKLSLERVPLPDTAIALGDLQVKQGLPDEAAKQYELARFIEESSAQGASVYSRHLALFWANRDEKLDDALRIAESESRARSDIYTCDLLAWCLFKKNDLKGAKAAIDEALRLGTRDSLIHYHAGMILNKLGDRQKAIKHLSMALQINPTFDLLQAEIAKQTLNEIRTGKRN